MQRLLANVGRKLAHNDRYDRPRIEAAGIRIEGPTIDTMWYWHVANSALEKGLGFVATFYCPDQPRWKHLGQVNPAYYSAVDAEVTLRIGHGILKDLDSLGLGSVAERHITQLDSQCLFKMSKQGILLNNTARLEASTQLQTEQVRLQAAMQTVVPQAARRKHVYKLRPPKGMDLVAVKGERKAKVCTNCGELDVKVSHTKRKVLVVVEPQLPLEGLQLPPRAIKVRNPCFGAGVVVKVVPTTLQAVLEPFVPSNAQMLAYCKTQGHKLIKAKPKKDEVPGKVRFTFDDMALMKLMGTYPNDLLYPLVGDYREADLLLGTFVGTYVPNVGWQGGPPIDRLGFTHTTYTHNPSTLRLSSQAPNLQNIPRDTSPYSSLIKKLFVAREGMVLLDVDFSAIEAVLVGYFAGSKDYIRLARLGVHDFLNSHILARDKLIAHPADVAWSDADLKAFFKDLKARFKPQRDIAKQIVHMTNYGGTPKRIHDGHPRMFSTIKGAKILQDLYYDVCPAVKVWQDHTVALADKQGYLRNPRGYLHRFYNVRSWHKERDGRWVAIWGEDAKAALAFGPQSTGAAIIKEAMLRLVETIVYPTLRLQVHDSLVCEVPQDQLAAVAAELQRVMQEPIPWLPLQPSWELGEHLWIGTEAKAGPNWGDLKELT